MNKVELEQLFRTDDIYKDEITKADEWISEFIKDTLDKDKSDSAAKYITKVIELISSFESTLTGIYSDEELEEFAPKKGDDFNLDSIEFIQTNLFAVHYRISLMNREAHKSLNPSIKFDEMSSPLYEVFDAIIDKKQTEIFIRGYVPKYVNDLEMNTK